MFLCISILFLALPAERRGGAGLPGTSGGRAARDPTYGQPPWRNQRNYDFMRFAVLFENYNLKLMKINAF